MTFKMIFSVLFALLLSFTALAIPTLEELKSQKRCKAAADEKNAFDCIVDQPDGSTKKIRFFQAELKKDEPKANRQSTE